MRRSQTLIRSAFVLLLTLLFFSMPLRMRGDRASSWPHVHIECVQQVLEGISQATNQRRQSLQGSPNRGRVEQLKRSMSVRTIVDAEYQRERDTVEDTVLSSRASHINLEQDAGPPAKRAKPTSIAPMPSPVLSGGAPTGGPPYRAQPAPLHTSVHHDLGGKAPRLMFMHLLLFPAPTVPRSPSTLRKRQHDLDSGMLSDSQVSDSGWEPGRSSSPVSVATTPDTRGQHQASPFLAPFDPMQQLLAQSPLFQGGRPPPMGLPQFLAVDSPTSDAAAMPNVSHIPVPLSAEAVPAELGDAPCRDVAGTGLLSMTPMVPVTTLAASAVPQMRTIAPDAPAGPEALLLTPNQRAALGVPAAAFRAARPLGRRAELFDGAYESDRTGEESEEREADVSGDLGSDMLEAEDDEAPSVITSTATSTAPAPALALASARPCRSLMDYNRASQPWRAEAFLPTSVQLSSRSSLQSVLSDEMDEGNRPRSASLASDAEGPGPEAPS
ncbi:uncharacterized protein MONBRDRAFT_22631 [Monosiga brevicollis MX1]|uniref:Transmembrane protein n=1 Tax=Monosiga brevicollis TaxID=81824 RepID=A9UNL0_MONBE|nr:uncharacterized protein MONBRDRAFT_22631 [Monosiga brevicollis MX1]EDQ92715.1 predicted protein [Monosiga brevicollis MX1]|eukprot:XP_001742477.1 hypothetical protein [Monosiga brevicollis MX1]